MWSELFKQESSKKYYKDLEEFLNYEYENYKIYPSREKIFHAYHLTPLNKVKVVIIGQDPYINENEAMGLAFSVNKDIKIPPSLKNIFKELKDDLGYEIPVNGDLSLWGERGVLLLNSTLTVRANLSNSHVNSDWLKFTDATIKYVSDNLNNIVFVLWGLKAIEKEKLIDKNKHLIITGPHPSPLSAYRGFFGSKPFSKINTYLEINGIDKINFDLNNDK